MDVRWSGGDGNRRATVVRRLPSDAGIQALFSQHPDGRGWELRVGPVPGEDVAKLIDQSSGSKHCPPFDDLGTATRRALRVDMYGIMYGMHRTTVYLPDELKAALQRTAAAQGRRGAGSPARSIARATSTRDDAPSLTKMLRR